MKPGPVKPDGGSDPGAEQGKSFRTFLWVWFGQVISATGSGLTRFAIGVHVYQETGSETLFALIAVAASLPAILLSPVAGVLVDRWSRRRAMIVADIGSAVATLGLVSLFAIGELSLGAIYALVALSSLFEAVQMPAFTASTTLLVPKRHFGRAAGMTQFGHAGARLAAPLLAGALLGPLGLPGVVALDVASFLIAMAILLAVRIPDPPRRAAAAALNFSGRWRSVLAEALEGWRFIRQRGGLLALLGFFAALNFVLPLCTLLTTPLVLSFADEAVLGQVLGFAAAGGIAGSVLMSSWGGPRRRVLGVLGAGPIMVLGLVIAGAQALPLFVATGLFLVSFCVPVVNGCSQALWQVKTPPALQGRVFATRRMVAQISGPVAFGLSGLLAERVMNPLLVDGGALADTFVGALLGVGSGRGIGLLFVICGVAFLAVTVFSFALRPLRRVDLDLEDAV
ncbi:MAG: MFS transporter [Acidobacteriota bacterium]